MSESAKNTISEDDQGVVESKDSQDSENSKETKEDLLCDKGAVGDKPPEGILNQDQLMKWLEPVIDPDVRLSIVSMGLIYSAEMTDDRVYVRMTLTSPMCPIGPELMANVKARVLEIPQVETTDVELVWEPQWDPRTMASDEVKDMLGIW